MMLTQLHARFGILLTYGKNVHDRIISLRRDVWACQTSSTPLFIEEHYQARKVSGHEYVSILPPKVSTIF
jgi:hypothetical protein